MINILEKLEKYVQNTLDIDFTVVPWHKWSLVPYAISDSYDLYELVLIQTPCILMIDKRNESRAPAQIEKQIATISALDNGRVIYVAASITSYDRKRLIERKIAFIVPDNQMYLPFLAVDLREYYRKPGNKVDKLGPAAQCLLLSLLQNPEWKGITPGIAAQHLGYTPTTMARAFEALYQLEVGSHWTSIREKHIEIDKQNRKQTWEHIQPYLSSPVTRKLFVRLKKSADSIPDVFTVAGLSALAILTNLADSNTPVYALESKLWQASIRSQFEIVPYPEGDIMELQLWKYPVKLISADHIDLLSLYLSLKNEKNERVQSALNSLLEGFVWSKV